MEPPLDDWLSSSSGVPGGSSKHAGSMSDCMSEVSDDDLQRWRMMVSPQGSPLKRLCPSELTFTMAKSFLSGYVSLRLANSDMLSLSVWLSMTLQVHACVPPSELLRQSDLLTIVCLIFFPLMRLARFCFCSERGGSSHSSHGRGSSEGSGSWA